MDLTFFESMMFFVRLISLYIPFVVGINSCIRRVFWVYILKYVQIVGVGKKEGWGMGEKVWRMVLTLFVSDLFIDLFFYVSKLPRFLLHPKHDWPRFTGDLLLHHIVYNIGHNQGVTRQSGWLYSQVH